MSVLLKALNGKNEDRAPVWLMRQAGRYLPEYRELRKQHSLRDLFFTPELAAIVTKMPIDRFGVDAAILFSDITVVALALGLSLDFQEGPKIDPEVNPENVSRLSFSLKPLTPIFETIALLKKELTVPLLGFCGAPFTVASYLVGSLEKTIHWMRSDSKTFQVFLEKILEATIPYLQMQEKTGVDAVQVFDSWANVLTPEEYRTYSLEPLKQLVKSIRVPSLFFMRGLSPCLEEIPCGISLDWTVSLKEIRKRTNQPLQGNLNPDLLFEPIEKVREETEKILKSMEGDPSFILNLGHGVKPGTPVEAVECFVNTVKLKEIYERSVLKNSVSVVKEFSQS